MSRPLRIWKIGDSFSFFSVENDEKKTVRHVTGLQAASGGALFVSGSQRERLEIQRSKFIDCSAVDATLARGGAVYVREKIKSCTCVLPPFFCPLTCRVLLSSSVWFVPLLAQVAQLPPTSILDTLFFEGNSLGNAGGEGVSAPPPPPPTTPNVERTGR
mgnify:CR=1 FL=1